MDTTLLATKLYIPAPGPQLVPRARIARQISTALQQGLRLVLVAAPAGFGKTTAVAEWSHSAGAPPVAWLALDDDDNSLARFLTYLIAAVETQHPGAGEQARVLLRAVEESPPTRAILTELLNGLAIASAPLVLVLEDFHVIWHEPIHAAVALLIERMPPRTHLIITSRADPPLPLARLRARRQLAELRAADLRFTAEEAARFTQSFGLDLTPAAVAMLEERTEGWAAGLQLAALTLQEQDAAQREARLAAFTGSHRYVLDYLGDEVLSQLPQPLQSFLMETGVLRRMCGPLCAAVTGQPDGQAMLEQLERANLFLVGLDDTRTWYRYHHLFADFLSRRLLNAVGEAGVVQVHQRASAWFEQQGLLDEAVDHALAAGDWARMLLLLSVMAGGSGFPDYHLDWQRWVAALPDDLLRAHPEQALGLAQCMVMLGKFETWERPLRLAEEGWREGHPTRLGETLAVRAGVALLHADHVRARQLAQHAYEQIDLSDARARALVTYLIGLSNAFLGDVAAAESALAESVSLTAPDAATVSALGARSTLGMTAFLRGRLREAAARYGAVIERTRDMPAQQQPANFAYMAQLQYEWNDLVAAETTLRLGITTGEQTGRIRYWPLAYWVLARVDAARGAWDLAESHLGQAVGLARMLGSPAIVNEAGVWRAQLDLAQGNLAAVERWIAARGLSVDDRVSYQRQSGYLLLARAQLAMARQSGSGDVAGVMRLLAQLLQAAEDAGRMRDVMRCLPLLALAHGLQQEPDLATQALTRALVLAEPEGYLRTFLDEGPALLELIASPGVRRVTPAYADQILRAASTSATLAPAAGALNVASSILSAREVAILHLLAQGQSLQAIAETLVISVHTARTHVKNIYGKLGVHNRVLALARAQELGIL